MPMPNSRVWPQHPLRLDHHAEALPRRPLRHISTRAGRALHQGRHVRTRLLPAVWQAVGAGDKAERADIGHGPERHKYDRANRHMAECDKSDVMVPQRLLCRDTQTLGFRPACTCPAAKPVPCVVLDPFVGSGTTAAVAKALGRDCSAST